MRIYLARHGETTGDLENRYGGAYDDHLTKRGIGESEELARKLGLKGIRQIYSSPKIRALETASIVAKLTGVRITVLDGLAERNHYGVLTGMVKSEALNKHPQHVSELQKGFRHNVEGSEPYQSFRDRAIKAFEEAASSHFSPMAIVTHGGVIRCIVREVLKKGEIRRMDACALLTVDKSSKMLSLIGLEGVELES